MGFSALLRAVGAISFPQQDFPFWAFQLVAGGAIAAASLRWLRREPRVPTILAAYAATLLGFLFFGRYFQGNYLGFIVSVAAPVAFLRPDLAAAVAARIASLPRLRRAERAPVPATSVLAPVTLVAETAEAPAE
jgi:hypothetical protein